MDIFIFLSVYVNIEEKVANYIGNDHKKGLIDLSKMFPILL